MIKRGLLILFLIFTTLPFSVSAQEQIIPVQEYRKAEVIKILEDKEIEVYENKQRYQRIEIKILDGSDKGSIQTIEHGKTIKLKESQLVNEGDIVVIYKGGFNEQVDEYQIIDRYRINNIYFIAILFFILVLGVGRLQGLGSIIGLGISFLVIMKFIVPQIISGSDPLLTSIIGSSIIMLTTIYLSHGFSVKTTIAIASTIITLIITGLLAIFAVDSSSLTGMGNELAYGFSFNEKLANLNLRGLLLGGIIIGTLGVLDDVTTTQSSTIFELKKANPSLSFKELIKRGFKVGKDHISAVVNTLVLAYTGASLPILILIIVNPSAQPLWLMLNSEYISEEVIRTLVGSFGLVLSVPIATILASWVANRKPAI